MSSVTSIDSESVQTYLNQIQFDYQEFDYSSEWLTLNYLNNCFKELESIKESFDKVKKEGATYIKRLDEIRQDAISNIPSLIPYVKASINDEFNFFTTSSINVNQGSHLMLRSGKGTDSDIISKLDSKDTVAIIEDDGSEWVMVMTEDGKIGYVKRSGNGKDYILVEKEGIISNKVEDEVIEDPILEEIEISKEEKEKIVNEMQVHLKDSSSGLRIRSSGEFGDNIIGYLHNNDKVQVLGNANENGFVEVKVGERLGYVSKDYLAVSTEEVADPKIETSFTKTVVTSGSNLNLRSIPSLDNNTPVGSIKPGTSVTVLSENNGWAEIKIDGKRYYVSSKYLK